MFKQTVSTKVQLSHLRQLPNSDKRSLNQARKLLPGGRKQGNYLKCLQVALIIIIRPSVRQETFVVSFASWRSYLPGELIRF